MVPSSPCFMHIYVFYTSIVIDLSILFEHERFGSSYHIPSTVSRSFRTSLFICDFTFNFLSLHCAAGHSQFSEVRILVKRLLGRESCMARVDFDLMFQYTIVLSRNDWMLTLLYGLVYFKKMEGGVSFSECRPKTGYLDVSYAGFSDSPQQFQDCNIWQDISVFKTLMKVAYCWTVTSNDLKATHCRGASNKHVSRFYLKRTPYFS